MAAATIALLECMRGLVATALFSFACCSGALARDIPTADRKNILDAIRPEAVTRAGQPVKIKVDRLNVDKGWAILIGELVPASGKEIEWRKSRDCDNDWDKMLWVVLQKSKDTWRIEQMDICAAEPPYWYLDDEQGLTWPCGVYAGMGDGGEETLEARCRKRNPRR